MAEDDRCTSAQRRRAAMAGDEPSPVHLRINHLPLLMREDVRLTMVELVLLESSPSVS